MLKRLLAIIFILLLSTNLCNASEKTCALIIGGNDFKTREYYSYVKDFLGDKIDTGYNIQKIWTNYWLEKGEIDEGKFTKDVMFDFAKYSKYDKVIYIVISDPEVEKTYSYDYFWGVPTTNTNVAVEVKALLISNNNIIHTTSMINNDDSGTSEKRAKKGAFKKALRSIADEMELYIK